LFNKDEANTTLGLLKGFSFYFSHHARQSGVGIVMKNDIKAGSGLSSLASLNALFSLYLTPFFIKKTYFHHLKLHNLDKK